MSLNAAISAIRASMVAVVLQGAKERGEVRLHTHHADNHWAVTVFPHGATLYENYAEEARGTRGTVEDLSRWELALLLEALAR